MWSWQRVVVVSVFVIGSVVCAVTGQDVIAAALVGAAGGLAMPQMNGKAPPNG